MDQHHGANLAGTTRGWTAADFNGDLLPIALSGTSVRIGSKDAAISYISPTQINALVPPDAPTGQTTVTVNGPAGVVASATINVDQFAPGLFMFDPENRRYVAAVLPDGTFGGKQGLFPGNPTLTRPLTRISHKRVVDPRADRNRGWGEAPFCRNRKIAVR